MAEAFALASPEFHAYVIAAQFSSDSSKVPQMGADTTLTTVINVLDPTGTAVGGDQVVALMTDALKQEVVSQPGFVSATLYRSLDSEHVVNYAQWDSTEDLAAMAQRVQAGDAPLLGGVFTAK